MINTLFISIFDHTKLFYSIFQSMDKEKFRDYWMTTNEYWSKYLLDSGVTGQDILELVYTEDDFLGQAEKQKIKQEILALEEQVDLNVFQVLMMDQFLRQNKRENIIEYVFLFYANIKKFLVSKNIDIVIAEPTNFNELLTAMICEQLDIPFIAPRNMRYPHNRFIFTEGYLSEKIVSKGGKETHDGEAVLEKFKEKQQAPTYFDINNKKELLSFKKISKHLKNRLELTRKTSKDHLTHHPIGNRIKHNLRKIVNVQILNNFFRYENLDDVNGRVAYYPLHVQPEASIDVLGSYFSDQLKLIKDIRRALPFDFTLVVKEHPNELGVKKLDFFKEIKKLYGVKLLKHSVSSFSIFDRVDLVLTVSGTSAYEAGMIGIPAITFSPVYFGELSSIRVCRDIRKLKGIILSLTSDFKRNKKQDAAFIENMLSKSYPAYWIDPFTDQGVLDNANVAVLASAFEQTVFNLVKK